MERIGSHREAWGGKRKRIKQGFLSEEDFEEDEGIGAESSVGIIEPQKGKEGNGGRVATEFKEIFEMSGAWEEDSEVPGEGEARVTESQRRESEQGESAEKGEPAKKRTRRRRNVVTVEDGRMWCSAGDRGKRKTDATEMVVVWPRREGIITQDMADPNRKIVGYRTQEFPVANARTSGVFWNASKMRDNRRFPGAAGKTLPRQSLESVPAGGAAEEEEIIDPLTWPRVRPPENGPR